MLLRSVVQPSSGAGAGAGTGVHPGNGSATGMELISGPKKSFTPWPLGPLVHSYEGCLSVHAVQPPWALTTSKMVFTRRYWWGKIGLQPLSGSRGRKSGLMPPPPLSCVRSKSTPSSNSTTAPPMLGHGPEAIPITVFATAGKESLRLKLTSYQKPVVVGEPPVTSAASPGKESEGSEAEALV